MRDDAKRDIVYGQADRPMGVATPLDPDALLLQAFRGTEAISRLFRFELDLIAANHVAIPFDELIGRQFSFRLMMPDGRYRPFHGICSRFSQGERDATFTAFRAEIVPEFWLLTRVARSRTFQNVSVPEILRQVLLGLDVFFDLRGAYQPRVFCAQYRETDFAFASRLMEEEGISYYFRHEADGHVMVVVDTPPGFVDLPDPLEVTFEDVVGAGAIGAGGGARDEGRVTAWEKSQELRSGKVSLRDAHFELPRDTLEAQALTPDAVRVGQVDHALKLGQNVQLELYDFPGGYARRFDAIDRAGSDQPGELRKIYEDARRVAALRMRREAASAILVRGEGNCRHFAAGYRFRLDRHVDGDGAYLLTRVEHVATLGDTYRSSDEADFAYENRFECLPAALPFCPPRDTPKPVIAGTQTARVVGPAGRQAFLDKLGRIKVLFPWDREGDRGIESSCWVRVAQPWAGNGWGAFFWPRIGHEVVVSFEEGDPDRPLVVGSVYNAENLPPFRPSSDPMVNGIKSNSEFGDPLGKFNGVVFYDEPGNEHTQVHSQKFSLSTNETGQCTQVGKNRVAIVGGLKHQKSGSGSGGAGDDEDAFDDLGTQSLDARPEAGDGALAAGADSGPAGSAMSPSDVVQSILEGLGWDADASGSWATDLSLAYGEVRDGTIGMRSDDRVGGHSEYHLDPFGWNAEVNTDDSLKARDHGYKDLEALGPMIGKNEVKLTNEGAFHYGVNVGTHRGRTTRLDGPLKDGHPSIAAAESTVLLRMLFTTLAGASTADAMDYKEGKWAQDNEANRKAVETLIGLEKVAAIEANVQKKAADLDAANAQLRKAGMQPDPKSEVGKFLGVFSDYLGVKSDEASSLGDTKP